MTLQLIAQEIHNHGSQAEACNTGRPHGTTSKSSHRGGCSIRNQCSVLYIGMAENCLVVDDERRGVSATEYTNTD